MNYLRKNSACLSDKRIEISFFDSQDVATRLNYPYLLTIKLILKQSDPNFADKIRHIKDPKARMAVVWAHCKVKMVCEPDETREEGEQTDTEEIKKGHGGCGHIQPLIRKEGLKLFVQYKKQKDDDDVSLRKH